MKSNIPDTGMVHRPTARDNTLPTQGVRKLGQSHTIKGCECQSEESVIILSSNAMFPERNESKLFSRC